MMNCKTKMFLFLILGLCLLNTPLLIAEEEKHGIAPESLPSRGIHQEEIPLEGLVIKRTPKLTMWPCNDCHVGEVDFNTQVRELKDEHIDKAVHFSKDYRERWCHSCHKEGHYTELITQGGETVSFDESYRLCGECHSVLYKRWQHNVHGKRIGKWTGPKQILSCPECHDPHAPKFKKMQSIAKPIRPKDTESIISDLDLWLKL